MGSFAAVESKPKTCAAYSGQVEPLAVLQNARFDRFEVGNLRRDDGREKNADAKKRIFTFPSIRMLTALVSLN